MGCSEESPEQVGETPRPAPTEMPIAFSGLQGEDLVVSQGTRAEIPLNEQGITTFTVWGYKNMDESYSASGLQTVMPAYTVKWAANSAATTTTNSNGWEYVNQQTNSNPEQTIKYWDWSATAYRFFAVTSYHEANGANGTYGANGANEANGANGANGAYRTYKYTIKADASSNETIYFSRLWFSTGNAADYPDRQFGQPVQLVFMQPYSKVRFMFTYVFPREGVTLSDMSFKPTDGSTIARKGTVTVSYPLTGTETKESYTTTAATGDDTQALAAFTEDYDPDNDSKQYTETVGGWYTVLPNTAQGSYTLTVKVNGADKTCAVPAEYMQWLPGYSYTYVFKINEEGGVEIDHVQSAVTKWTEMEKPHPVYNW